MKKESILSIISLIIIIIVAIAIPYSIMIEQDNIKKEFQNQGYDVKHVYRGIDIIELNNGSIKYAGWGGCAGCGDRILTDIPIDAYGCSCPNIPFLPLVIILIIIGLVFWFLTNKDDLKEGD